MNSTLKLVITGKELYTKFKCYDRNELRRRDLISSKSSGSGRYGRPRLHAFYHATRQQSSQLQT